MLPALTLSSLTLAPQKLPAFYTAYHEKSAALTEAALRDTTLQCTRALQYGPKSHQKLDVWASADVGSATGREHGARKGMPIVVGIHGGGWNYGIPEWAGFVATHVCASGALYVTPAYELGKGTHQSWPACRDDLILALRYLHDHPSRLVLTGHSAGGHLASCLGLAPALLRSRGLDPSAIRALFVVSGPLGLRAKDLSPFRWMWRFWLTRPLIWLLFALLDRANILLPVLGRPANRETAVESSALASLETAEAEDLPPHVHFTYGTNEDEQLLQRAQARELQRIVASRPALAKRVRIEVLECKGAGHFDTHWQAADGSSAWTQAMRRATHAIRAEQGP